MNFKISESELEAFDKWQNILKEVFDIDRSEFLPGYFTYTFTPSGMGTGVDVTYYHPVENKEPMIFKKELTDYTSW